MSSWEDLPGEPEPDPKETYYMLRSKLIKHHMEHDHLSEEEAFCQVNAIDHLSYFKNIYPENKAYSMVNQMLSHYVNTYSATPSTYKSYEMLQDGNCLFRCIAWKVYDDPNEYQKVRYDIASFARSNPMVGEEPLLFWIQNSDEEHQTIDNYISWIIMPGQFCGYLEMILASEIYDIRIIVMKDNKEFYRTEKTSSSTLYISYENDNHYNVISKD